jgi:hypothetical protein
MATTLSTRLAAAVACVGVLGVTACGGESKAPAAGQPAAASPTTVFGADTLARCGGFGAAEAAPFLGVAASEVADHRSNIAPNLRSCMFAKQSDEASTVTFTISREDSIKDATESYAQFKDNIPIASSAQKAVGVDSGDSALIEISGLGDEALWTNVNGALTVRFHNLTILVMSPSDRKTQISVAEKVLAGLR